MATMKVGVYRKYHGPIPTDGSGRKLARSEWPKRRRHSWAARWFGSDGRRYSRSFETRKEAERYAEEKQSNVREGHADPPPEVGLFDFAREHESLMAGQVSRGTLREQTRVLRYLEDMYGNHPLRQFARRDAEGYIKRRSDSGVSASTINKEVATLRRVFNLAADRRGYLLRASNPFAGIGKRKVSQRPKRYVSGDEMQRILRCIPLLKWRTFLSLLYTTGLRLSEACHLTWDDIDFAGRMVQVAPKRDPGTRVPWEPKDHELRAVPLSPRILELLGDLKSACEDGVPYVFLSRARHEEVMRQFRAGKWYEGRAIINNVLRNFKAIVHRAGVGRCTLHDLRRSCLTNWARELPAHVVQKLAGHSSVETTLRYYLCVGDADLEKARDVGDTLALAASPTDPKLTHKAKKGADLGPGDEQAGIATCPKSLNGSVLCAKDGWCAR